MPLRLKDVRWGRFGEDLLLYTPVPEEITLADPSGDVERLLSQLRGGVDSAQALADALSLPVDDIADALSVLDGLGLVTATETGALTAWQRERYRSNLALFEVLSGLDRAPSTYQEALLRSHVVALGTGGLGSAVLQALTGFGVGRFTLVDFDRIERKNLARQYLYRESDIGRLKVESAADWVRGYTPDARVTAVNARIDAPEDVSALLADADLVIGAIDQPFEVRDWVDEACVTAGVPYVFGSGSPFSVSYWSVDPGRTACRGCSELTAETGAAADAEQLARMTKLAQESTPVNIGTGPVVSLLGGLVAVEAMRYLTGFTPAVAAGRLRLMDLSTGDQTVTEWTPHPACPRCQAAKARAREAEARTHG